MNHADANASQSLEQARPHTILTVAQSGAICGVVEAGEDLREQLDADSDSASVSKIWGDAIGGRIRKALRQVILSRSARSLDEEDCSGASLEFILVPQGPDRVLMIVRDLSDQERARHLAFTDDLTGLPNREHLFAELKKITDVQRLKEGRSAVICLHIGQLDDFGYALSSGQKDDVLVQLSELLKSGLRGTNSDNPSDFERYSFVARADYRQFCVVLPSIESGEDAEAVANRLVESLRRPVTIANRSVTVNACGGIALFPQDGPDWVSLYENAIAAMEDARSEPDTLVRFHSGTVRLRTLQRSDLEAELSAALQNDDYDLSFLPVVHADSGAPVILEALLRWPDAVLGSEPTSKIVRVAERTGLIVPIGRWVLRHACLQLQKFRAAGHDDVRVAVNLSAQEIVSDGIVEHIAQVLTETNTDACDLDIELKEQSLLRELQSDFAICRKLKELGVRIIIDDYGVGTCSLTHLSHSPIDALKIHNSFVANIAENERDRAACRAALAMARELGIEVIAEGVETAEQAAMLKDLGCRYLQGFAISEPMTTTATLDFLHAHAAEQNHAEESRELS